MRNARPLCSGTGPAAHKAASLPLHQRDLEGPFHQVAESLRFSTESILALFPRQAIYRM
jgi:hypothetical protein